MHKLSYLLIAMLVLAGCSKTDDDLSGDSDISGRLYIQNVWDSTGRALVAAHDVFVRKDTLQTATSFLSGTQSDKDGFFSFRYLYKNVRYGLHSEIKANTSLDNNILFSADTVINPGNKIELVMTPDLKTQNALFVSCVDTLTPAGVLSAATVIVYTSRVLAENDLVFDGTGSYQTFKTKSNGTAFKMNLPYERDIYAKAILKVGTLTLKSSIQSIRMKTAGLELQTFVLRR